MGAAIAASVDLSVAVRSSVAFPVPIPKGFQFKGPNNLIFETAKAVTFPANAGLSNPITIPCYEGETLTETFVSDGTPNQVFKLAKVPSGKFAVAGTVLVTVNGAAFTESEFLTFDATDQFEFAANDDPPTVRFGDGTTGNIPVIGAVILVTYVASKGRGGLVLKNTITKVVSPLVVLFQTIQLSIDNPAPSVGGDDAESIERAKLYAPLVFKSRHVAITRPDYEALAGSFADPLFGRVAVAQAISSRSAATDLALQILLSSINSTVSGPDVAVAALVVAALLKVADINAQVATLTTTFGLIATDSTNASNAAIAARVSARSVKARSLELAVNAGSISSAATSGKTATNSKDTPPSISVATSLNFVAGGQTVTRVGGDWVVDGVVPGMRIRFTGTTLNSLSVLTVQAATPSVLTMTGGVSTEGPVLNAAASVNIPENDRLSTASKNTLADLWDGIDADQQSITTTASTIGSAADSEVGSMGVIIDLTTAIGLTVTTPESKLLSASGNLTAITADTAGLATDLASIDDTVSDVTLQIEGYTSEIGLHVDQMLSADCKVNLVSVPILTKDNTGFYAAPSIGLVQSLQSFLDGKKEVTQTVSVTSGISFLVGAVVLVRVGVLKGYALSTVQKGVEAEIDAVLRDRKFGISLFVSELDEAVRKVAGVGFRNVEIQGNLLPDGITVDVSRLDADGNLIVTIGEIVSKGLVVVNTETILSS